MNPWQCLHFLWCIPLYYIQYCRFLLCVSVWRARRPETFFLKSASVINLLIACSVFGHNSILSLVCKTALSSEGDLATANPISQLVIQYYPLWPDLALLLRPVIKASFCLLLRSHQEPCCEFRWIPAFECLLSSSEPVFPLKAHTH